MHAVTFKNTGHMLGILTRSADMGGALDPAVALPNGARMTGPFRGNSTTPLARMPSLLVPVDQIGIVSSKILRSLLLRPTRGVATGSDAQPLPEQTRAPTFAVNVNEVTVTTNLPPPNPAQVAVDTNFWVLIEEADPADPSNPGRRVTRGLITSGQTHGTANITLTALPLDAPSNATPPPAAPLTAGSRYFAVVFLAQHAPEVAEYAV
jgi:hypothetical protein